MCLLTLTPPCTSILYIPSYTTIYIKLTLLRVTILLATCFDRLLRPSSGQFYTLYVFHVRTIWDPIVLTDTS
jgi:hypothetical protein